jgi:hypothetical protein
MIRKILLWLILKLARPCGQPRQIFEKALLDLPLPPGFY